MKAKLTFALLSLPVALLTLISEANAKVINHRTFRFCDTTASYAAPVLKPTTVNAKNPASTSVITTNGDDALAKRQMKAYLDSLTIDGNPVGVSPVKKDVKLKNNDSQKQTGTVSKKNNLSRNIKNARNAGDKKAANQYFGLYDPDESNPVELSALTK